MSNIIIIPLNSAEELLMFHSTVKVELNLNELEPILFVKLYELLRKVHPKNTFAIWGVASGIKSAYANKWNKIAENDLVIFTQDKSFIGYSKVKAKFQSENVSNKLWPSLNGIDIRQYLFTLEKFAELDTNMQKRIDEISRKNNVKVDNFDVIENRFSLHFNDEDELLDSTLATAGFGQGFGLSAVEKKIIEKHAVTLAIEHLSKAGFEQIEDVGDSESFDILASNDLNSLSIEVKGTTGLGQSITLTKNEVIFQKDAYPNNGLFVVRNIVLVRGEKLSAQGGDIEFISPWLIDEQSLVPISYDYRF